VLSESGAITSYLLEKFDTEGNFSPARTDLKAWATYSQWLGIANLTPRIRALAKSMILCSCN
jgi:glutathione S-transferase